MYDGTVRCWGKGADGRLGNGRTSDSASLVTVEKTVGTTNSTLGDIMQVASGGEHTCALDEGGEVWCWGKTEGGRLGYTPSSSQAHMTRAQKVSGLSDIVHISAGGAHTCALDLSAQVQCWGEGGSGQLGNNLTDDSTTPVTVKAASGNSAADLSSVAWLDAGRNHTCAVLTSGQVWCWGEGSDGRLGDNASVNRSYAVSVKAQSGSAVTIVENISQKSLFTCAAVSSKDAKRCWPSSWVSDENLSNTLLLSRALQSGLPSQSSVGNSYHCAFTSSGKTKCWGQPSLTAHFGVSGSVITSPSTVRTSSQDVVGVDYIVGGGSFCSVSSMGRQTCQGYMNINKQQGSTTVSMGTINGKIFQQVSGNYSVLCGVLPSGEVDCVGSCSHGQLGHFAASSPDTDCVSSSFKRVKTAASGNPPLVGAMRVTVSAGSACAIMEDKRVMCWGSEQYGKLGNGASLSSTKISLAVPVRRTESSQPLQGVVQLAAESQERLDSTSWCALMDSGRVKCWGEGGRSGEETGEMGTGERRGDSSIPLDVVTAARTSTNPNPPVLTGVVQITGGENHYCALLKSGQVWCWGYGVRGRLGDGHSGRTHYVPYAAPVLSQRSPAVSLTGVAEVSANDWSVCALLLSGEVKCWGRNTAAGVLGTRDERNTSVSIPKDVFAGPTGTALFNIFD